MKEIDFQNDLLPLKNKLYRLAQRITLDPQLTLLETVQRANPGASEQHLRDQLARLLFRRESVHQRIGDLSGGERFRVAVAQVLLADPVPQLLILDEPTNGLDPAGIMEIRKLITSLPKERDITVIISSHLLNEIEQMADYVGIINHGQMLYQGKLSSLESSGQSLEQIFLKLTGERESL